MKKAVIIGGTSGIGCSLANELLKRGYDNVICFGKVNDKTYRFLKSNKIQIRNINLLNNDFSFLEEIDDTFDTLIITSGFGRVALFEDLADCEVKNLITVNYLSAAIILHKFYSRIKSDNNFYTAVIGSIAGHVVSPLFSVYGSSKSGLCSLIENINSELMAEGFSNRILDVSPGVIKGTSFTGGLTDLSSLEKLSNEILDKMYGKKTLFIPNFDDIYKEVIERYHKNPKEFGLESYKYKKDNNRISSKPQVVIGYLSGTFDLFHIGHLNLLKRAKENCDYLIVGVHESGAWKGKETFIPFEERLEIIRSIKFVDEAVMSCKEDSDAWEKYHYHKLFVGDDYKNTERFNRYEKFFADKGVEIVYFPYTKGTSSTQLRVAIKSS